MRQQISFLTQSRFYSPAFNAAIFDGPVRIYFAQYQESLALKVYFKIQDRLKESFADVRESFRRTGMNIFVMLYPSSEAFSFSFDEAIGQDTVVVERLGTDFVVGVRGPMVEDETTAICDRIEEIARSVMAFQPARLQKEVEEAEL
jgi:hypothetical protein